MSVARHRRLWTRAPVAVTSLAATIVLCALKLADLLPFRGTAFFSAAAFGLSLLACVSLVRAFRVLDEAREEEESEAALAREKFQRDHSTGALLRRFFLEACEERLAASAASGPRYAYIAIDLDFLKHLNDSFGHEIGDRALVRVVEAIDECFGKAALVGRLGGDEFAFLLPCEAPEDPSRAAEALLAAIRQPVLIRGHELMLSASLGVVLIPDQTRFLSEAIQFSDLALYKGKREGRDRATLFDRTMLLQFRRERQIERELRVGLERDEFRHRYLPIVDASGSLKAARTQIEWTSRWLGEIASEDFLRIAQGSNLIHRLAQASLARACADVARLGDLPITLALFPAQLKRDNLVATFRETIEASGIEPRLIIVSVGGEIVELTRQPKFLQRLRDLRALGVRVVLDDLGTLVCNFEQLRQFPADFVRISDEQVAHLGESEIDNVMVSAMASVGAAMGLGITANGIATRAQMLLARTAGCTRFTGPLFGDAKTIEELTAAVAAERSDIRVPTPASH